MEYQYHHPANLMVDQKTLQTVEMTYNLYGLARFNPPRH